MPLLVFLASITLLVPLAQARQPQVRCVNLDGTGGCFVSIASAVAAAVDGDTIQIAAGTYGESGILVDKAITIAGAGTGDTVVDGASTFAEGRAIFQFGAPTSFPARQATISNLTIAGGYRGVHAGGCANDITLDHVRITGNGPGSGAGYFNNCSVVRLYASRVDNNHATRADLAGCDWGWGGTGGGIASLCGGGANIIRDSTIDHNTATFIGGGLAIIDTTTLIENSTISDNTATSAHMDGSVPPAFGGGGVWIAGAPRVSIRYSTIADNAAPNGAGGGIHGGILDPSGTLFVSLEGSIVSGNTALSMSTALGRPAPGVLTANCGSWWDNSITSLGGNVVSDESCQLAGTDDLSGTAALLGPLADNGGATPTRALLPGSAGIDHATACGVTGAATNTATTLGFPELIAADQRVTARPLGAACDSGAFEAPAPLPVDTTPPVITVPATLTFPAPTAAGAVVTYPATAVDAVDGAVPVTCSPASGTLMPPTGLFAVLPNVFCTAVDASGNAAYAAFRIKVEVVDDADVDGVSNAVDNCRNVANPAQEDNEPDGVGNVCDTDDDNDTLSDLEEVARGTNPLRADSDGDGWDDRAELACSSNPTSATSMPRDNDGDRIADCEESDMDNDGVSDDQDADIDGDGIPNANDMGPFNKTDLRMFIPTGVDTSECAQIRGSGAGLVQQFDRDFKVRQCMARLGVTQPTWGLPSTTVSVFPGLGFTMQVARVPAPQTFTLCGRFSALVQGGFSFLCGSVHLRMDEGEARVSLDPAGTHAVVVGQGASATVDDAPLGGGLSRYSVLNENGGTVTLITPAGTQAVPMGTTLFVVAASRPDADTDGIIDQVDNCPAVSNAGQPDYDNDGQGDACDADMNGDGVDDAITNDDDGDGVLNPVDSCRWDANADQQDSDGDTVGDACDVDADNNGIFDQLEGVCPVDPGTGLLPDLDRDRTPDCVDVDQDGDGLANADELARGLDPRAADSDHDGVGDGPDRWPLDGTRSFDRDGPVLTGMPSAFSVVATGVLTRVSYAAPAAVDAVTGPAVVSCSPASGSLLTVGAHPVTCAAADAYGNASAATFVITVNDITTPGEMRGEGFIRKGSDRYGFEFEVRERSAGERGRLKLEIAYAPRPVLDSRGKSKSRHAPGDSFRSTGVTFVAFSDDPTIRSGREPRPQVDSVMFSGVGQWNGQRGYTFEVRAAGERDRGRGRGRHRESVAIIIRDAAGSVVADVSGEIDGGNIQLSRIHRNHRD